MNNLIKITCFFLMAIMSLNAKQIKYDLVLGDHNNIAAYMHDLIKQSLENNGHVVTIKKLSKKVRVKRVIKKVVNEEVNLLWLGKARKFPQRHKLYKLDIGLTSGLKAKQILFIHKKDQVLFDKVKTLDDFRKINKIAAFGKGWAAVKYWEHNNLKYLTFDGAAKNKIEKMHLKGNRGFDYFTKGVLSGAKILKKIPNLVLEKNLILEFNDDFILYFPKNQKILKDDLEVALQKSIKNGLMMKLLKKHFPFTFDENILNYEKRIKIQLPYS